MHAPAIPFDEAARLDAVNGLEILDTCPEERFDRITRIANGLFGTPIALVSLVDEKRQWFKSRIGLDVSQNAQGHLVLRPYNTGRRCFRHPGHIRGRQIR